MSSGCLSRVTSVVNRPGRRPAKYIHIKHVAYSHCSLSMFVLLVALNMGRLNSNALQSVYHITYKVFLSCLDILI